MHLERPSIYPFKVLCDFFREPPDICDEKCVLNEHGELLSKAEAVKTVAEVYNQLINKVNKRRHLSVSEPVPALLGSVHSLPAGLS